MRRKFLWLLPLFLMVLLGVPAFAEGTYAPPAAERIDTIYAINHEYQTYHPVERQEWEKIRSALTLPTKPMTEDAAAKNQGGFCFVLKDGERIIYTVTDSQVLVGNTPLMASIFQRQAAEKLSETLCGQYPAHPAMLAYMNPAKATALTVKGSGGTNGRIDPEKPLDFTVSATSDPDMVKNFVRTMAGLKVKEKATEVVSWTPGPDGDDNTLYLGLQFNTGTRYDMTLTEKELFIRSSDGIRTYRYPLHNYNPSSYGNPLWVIRDGLWNAYTRDAGCTEAAVFLTQTATKERVAGAFYSAMYGGDLPLAKLSRAVDNILAAKPLPTVTPAGKTFVELYITLGETGELRRFELDETLTAYYLNSAGRGVSVAVSREDWDTIRGLLGGQGSTENLMLTEKGEERRLVTLMGGEWFVEPLFSPLPKDPAYKPYNTGPKPDYAVNGVHCWATRGGVLTETTVYPATLVQQSNLLPWTPAKYDAEELYKLLDFH